MSGFAADDAREMAGQSFAQQLAPLLQLAVEHPTSEELWIDGDEIRLSFGDRETLYSFDDFPGVDRRKVQAAGRNAAVFADVPFGPRAPARPYFSVMLPNWLRVSYVGPPVCSEWHVAIRFLRTLRFSLADYVTAGVMTEGQRRAILDLLHGGQNIVISGGTGSGKTTLLRACLSEISNDRLIVLEDTPELAIEGRNVVQMRTTEEVSLSDLLRLTLRFSPQRIIVGEVRGVEALELVTAMNTGHEGSVCTLHSNGARQALSRLHTQCRKLQPNFPFEEIEHAVHAVIQIEGKGRNRRIAEIWRPR